MITFFSKYKPTVTAIASSLIVRSNLFALLAMNCSLLTVMTSCMSDLDDGNIDPKVETTVDMTALYSKCYACLIMEGMDGEADFTIDDAGKSTLIRNIFNANELSTDEAICWWTDGGLINMDNNTPTPSDDAIRILYYRLIMNVSYCNDYLSQEKADEDSVKKAEVRLIRAYHYMQLLDLFGNPSFITTVSNETPRQACCYYVDSENPENSYDAGKTYTRQERLYMGRKYLFSWIVSELKMAEANLMDASPRTDSDADYGRVDKAAAWLLLSRLYLNAGTYLNDDGQNNPYWQLAYDYAKKVIDSPYKLFNDSLESASAKSWDYTPYDMLFCGDNGSNGSSVEAIFPLLQDGKTTRGWGGTMFFIAGLWNSDMYTATGTSAGTSSVGSWSPGIRCRQQLIEKFTDTPEKLVDNTAEANRKLLKNEGIPDDRAMFWGKGHKLTCLPNDATSFFNGLASPKWNNQYTTGASSKDAEYVDTDFFLLRKAEAYLNAAEALIHLNGENDLQAKEYMETIRHRAHNTNDKTQYSLGDVLDERAREFYFEGQRRTDLIRNNKFGGITVTYGWEGKGGNTTSITGAPFEKYINVYPIPANEMSANTSLVQNPGY